MLSCHYIIFLFPNFSEQHFQLANTLCTLNRVYYFIRVHFSTLKNKLNKSVNQQLSTCMLFVLRSNTPSQSAYQLSFVFANVISTPLHRPAPHSVSAIQHAQLVLS